MLPALHPPENLLDLIQGAKADREILCFPVQLTTCRIGNLIRLINTLAIRVTKHDYIDYMQSKYNVEKKQAKILRPSDCLLY